MTSDFATVGLRLRTPNDIVEAVPYLVGFQPEDSMVVLALSGVRSRLGMTARIDLAAPRLAGACARDFADLLERDHADRAIVVFYPPSEGLQHPAVLALAEAMAAELDAVDIEICELLCVFDGRWWSVTCCNSDCCPAEGTPVPHDTESACAVAMLVEGRVVLGSREELASTLDPVGGVLRSAMAYALPRVRAAIADRVAAGGGAEVVAESLDLFYEAIDDATRADRSVEEIARLIAGLDHVYARDDVISWSTDERGEAIKTVLLELARHAVPPHGAPTLTTLAWIAYLQGDGAFAGIALERALDADPEYPLATILDRALFNGMNPSIFRPSVGGWQSLLPPHPGRRASRAQRRRPHRPLGDERGPGG
jgi:hypothetical protein